MGVLFGSDTFIASELGRTVSNICQDMPKIAVMRDGLMHYQLLRFCESTHFTHVIHALRLIVSGARLRVSIKSPLMSAFETNSGCEMPDADVAARYETVRQVIRAPLREGGFCFGH